MKKILILLIINLSSLIIYAQPTLEWARRYNGSANAQDEAHAIDFDRYGNVYVTGTSAGTGTGFDYCTIKYNSLGDSLWVRRYNETNYDISNDISVDSVGYVYVTGSAVTIKYSNIGSPIWVSQNNAAWRRIIIDNTGYIYVGGDWYYDYVTSKLNSNGNLLWRNTYNGPANDQDRIKNMVIDPFGNIIVTGDSRASGAAEWDYCTIKYNSDGDSLWMRRYDGIAPSSPRTDWSYGIAADYIGNIYVTGWSRGADNNFNILTIKYNTVGDSVWVRRYAGSPSATGHDIKTDSFGNVFVLGVENGYYIILKYTTDGTLIGLTSPIWGHSYASSGTPKIILDNNNFVYLAGNRYVNTTRSDILIAKFQNNLTPVWETQYHAGASSGDVNDPAGIKIDSFGNIYVTGSGPGLPGNGADYITLKFSQVSGIIKNNNYIPKIFSLHQSYPNPFNAETKINFDLPRQTTLKLSIFDITGGEVESLINESLGAGSYSVSWDGTNFASGIYFCILQTGDFLQSIKLLLIK